MLITITGFLLLVNYRVNDTGFSSQFPRQQVNIPRYWELVTILGLNAYA